MSQRLVIGSRSSALARLQAYHVAAAIKRKDATMQIEFAFKESAGDKDLETPLWQMTDKGVFTRDLTNDLLAGKVDFVIHSHKDLETEPNKGTDVVSVLPRADTRDVIFFKSDALKNQQPENLKIHTSSPRRQYNLTSFLQRALPTSMRPKELVFEAIRGNIQTRLRKFMELDGHGFVIAKAALDRILADDFPEAADADFTEIRIQIRNILQQCHAMVLPLSWNPCAPAQGAFAMEFRESDKSIGELADSLTHTISEISVVKEREILAAYGGGCHQKIGAVYLPLGNHSITFTRGQTDDGKVLDQALIEGADGTNSETKASDWPPAEWPGSEMESMNWDDVIESDYVNTEEFNLYHQQDARVFEADAENRFANIICSKNVTDWFNLADQNLWITASCDGLGWAHAPDMTQLV